MIGIDFGDAIDTHYISTKIIQAISKVKSGEAIGTIQSQPGYHLLRLEKCFPTELNESVRKGILDILFKTW